MPSFVMKSPGLSDIEFQKARCSRAKAVSAPESMAARKQKRDAVVKYDIFAQCAKLEKVPFWITFFKKCSLGDFAKGLSYKDGALQYKKLRRKAVLKVDIPQDPALAIDVVKEFVRKELQTISDDELTKKRIEMRIAIEQNVIPSDVQWKDIRAPTQRQQMLNMYVWHHVENGYITTAEAENFIAIVTVGLATGALTSANILMEGGKIVDITGIDHNENGFHLLNVPPPQSKPATKPAAGKPRQISSYHDWEKLDTQYKNYMRTGFIVK